MKTLHKLLLGGIVTMAICVSGAALAQDNSDALRVAVVKLKIQRADGGIETAAGLFVGKDQQIAYFITAAHAVERNDRGVEVRSVQIEFRAGAQSFDAVVFERYNPTLDLSVVQTAITNLPPGLPLTVRKDVAAGSPVRIIGHPQKVSWSVWRGNVEKEYGPNEEPYKFITNLDRSLVGGYSGGPVFNSDGQFVGMHTGTDPSYGIATKAKDILDQLTAWRIPTDNLPDVPPISDPDAIKRVLQLYEAAYDQQDAAALWRIWPNPAAKTRGAIEKSFPTASSISMKLHYADSAIKIDGVTATVSGQFAQVFISKAGDAHTREGAIIFKLKKYNGVWTILEVQ